MHTTCRRHIVIFRETVRANVTVSRPLPTSSRPETGLRTPLQDASTRPFPVRSVAFVRVVAGGLKHCTSDARRRDGPGTRTCRTPETRVFERVEIFFFFFVTPDLGVDHNIPVDRACASPGSPLATRRRETADAFTVPTTGRARSKRHLECAHGAPAEADPNRGLYCDVQ